MIIVKVKVIDQTVEIEEMPNIYSGDVGTDFIECSFNDVWKDYKKQAVFYVYDHKTYSSSENVGGKDAFRVVIPHEVLAKPGKVFFGLIVHAV